MCVERSVVGLVGFCGKLHLLRPVFRESFCVGHLAGSWNLMFCLLSFLIGSTNLSRWLEFTFLQKFPLQQSSSTNGHSFLRRNALKPRLVDVTGAAIIERIEGIVLLILWKCWFFALEGVVMPSFDDHLREENKGNGVKRLCLLVLALQLPIIKEVSCWFEFIELLLRLAVHFIHKFELFRRCICDKLRDCGQFNKMVEGLMIAKVDSLLHEVHLVEQHCRSLL